MLQANRIGYLAALSLLVLLLTNVFSASWFENTLLFISLAGLCSTRFSNERVLFPLVLFVSVIFLSALFNQMETELFFHSEFRSFLKGIVLGGCLLLYSQDATLPRRWLHRVLLLSLFVFTANYFRTGTEDPNFAAIFFGIGVLYLWSLKKVSFLALSLFPLFSLVLTQSRMGLLAFFLAALVNLKNWWLRSALVLGMIGTILLSGTGQRMQDLRDNSNTERLWTYRNALRVFAEKPLLGAGWNRSPDTYFEYGFRGPFRSEAQRLHTHNTYLQILAEHGVAGFAAFVIFLVAMTRGLKGAMVGVAICLSLNALTLPLQSKDFYWLFWMLLSL